MYAYLLIGVADLCFLSPLCYPLFSSFVFGCDWPSQLAVHLLVQLHSSDPFPQHIPGNSHTLYILNHHSHTHIPLKEREGGERGGEGREGKGGGGREGE